MAILHDYSALRGALSLLRKIQDSLRSAVHDAIVYLEAKILHGATTLWGQVKIAP